MKPIEQEILEHIINRFYGGKTFDVDPKVNRIHTFEEHKIEGIGAVVQMLDGTEYILNITNPNWKQKLEILCADSCISESKILINIPQEYHSDWDNFMRGKTCPLLDNGDHGVYSLDVNQFLNKFQK